MGSHRAFCLVGREIILLRETRIRMSFKLWTFGFRRSSFTSLTIIILFVVSKALSIFLLRNSKKFPQICETIKSTL